MFYWVLASGMFLEVEVWVSLYGIAFDSTWTTVDSKDGAVGVSGYDGTWVTGEWGGTGSVNGASGRSGGVNGEGGGSGAKGETGESAHLVEGIVRSSCLPIISLISSLSLWKNQLKNDLIIIIMYLYSASIQLPAQERFYE